MNPLRLIGIAGRARSGKSTAQAILADEFGMARINFADPIKDALTTMLGVDFHALDGAEKEAQLEGLGLSPRHLMQTLGTEWGRHQCGSDFWIAVAERRLAQLEDAEGDSYPGAVFSDVRFNEEAEWIRRKGGLLIHLQRDDAAQVREHASERGIYPRRGDIHLDNSGSLTDLRHALIRALAQHANRRATCA